MFYVVDNEVGQVLDTCVTESQAEKRYDQYMANNENQDLYILEGRDLAASRKADTFIFNCEDCGHTANGSIKKYRGFSGECPHCGCDIDDTCEVTMYNSLGKVVVVC